MISVATLLQVVFAVKSCAGADGHVGFLKIGFTLVSCIVLALGYTAFSRTNSKPDVKFSTPWTIMLCSLLIAIIAVVTPGFVTCAVQNLPRNDPGVNDILKTTLSPNASVAPVAHLVRWSDFAAPDPSTVVTIANANDALATLKYCIAGNVSFLVQGGGNGWAKFNCGADALLIDMGHLKHMKFCSKKHEVTVGAGVLISDLIAAADRRGLQVSAGNCNCISVIGAMLGGGLGRLQGEYGLMVDNVVSMEVITPQGQLVTVDEKSQPELWFAMRGAGANFGIVTSATFKTYPVARETSGAWTGPLIFSEDKLEILVEAINQLEVTASMAIFLYFATKAPTYEPAIIAIPFYLNGCEEEGREAFASILDIGPVVDATKWTAYGDINTSSEQFCKKGGRKPSYGAALKTLDPKAWCRIWAEFKEFVKQPGTQDTLVLVEKYSWGKAQEVEDRSSAFPFRNSLTYNAGATLSYQDPTFDETAQAFGEKIRHMWRSSSGLSQPATYINYGFGDESPSTIYGENLATLQKLKQAYDPEGRFNQWFPLS